MQSLDDIWDFTLEEMRKEYSQLMMRLWFNDIKLRELSDSSAVLVCETDFKCNIVKKNYSEPIKKYLSQTLGFNVSIEIISKDDITADDTFKNPHNETDNGGADDKETFQDAEEKNFQQNMSVFPKQKAEYTFNNFIVGNSNKFAHAACLAVANNPAKDYNPLFVYGASGLGKTHLLYAISNRILENDPESNIIYVKGEEFMNEMIENISRSSTSQFRDKYRKADVLLIDDIQFIAGKDTTQEEFFHTFNALYQEDKQIIMTSDRPPRDIKTLEDRLKTRFEWGLIADIQPPDFELRIAIMKNKAKSLGLSISNEVFNFLAENLRSNVRQLEGAIKKIGAQSYLNKTNINLDLAVACTSDLLSGNEPVSVTVDKIIDSVAKKYGVSAEDLKGRKAQRETANPRHIAIFIIRKLTDMSLPAIAKVFGRHHTTIMSSIENIDMELKSNSLLEIEINELIKEIKE